MLTEDQIVAGQNFIWAVAGAAVAALYAYRCIKGTLTGEAFWLGLGVVLVAGGGTLHRAYWFIGRAMRADNPGVWETFASHAAWALFPVVSIIILGYGAHLMPLFEHKRRAAGWLAAAAFGVWLTGAYLG